MKFDKVDKIIVKKNEVEELFKWKDNNKDLVRKYKPILLKGIIELIFSNSSIYFKHDLANENIIRYQYYYKKEKLVDFKYDRTNWVISNLWTDKNFEKKVLINEEGKNAMIADILSMHSSLMSFVENFESEIEIKEETQMVKKGKIKKGKKRNKNNKNQLIKKKKYIIPENIKEVIENTTKREYIRQVEEWTRKGHWRRYRDSKGNIIKKVWINQTTCKSSKKTNSIKKEKIYTLGIDNTENK